MRRPTLILLIALFAVTTACSSSNKTESSAATTPPTTVAASTTTPGGTAYATKDFVVPLAVTVDRALKSLPSTASSNLLSWDATASSDNKVRFMVPVELYNVGSSTPETPPADYVAYVQGLERNGAVITHETTATVDGHPASVMDLTVAASNPDGALDGTLGCPERGADKSDGCYGPQPELLLRLAVVDVGKNPLLMWARVLKANPDAVFLAAFDHMLKSVHLE